MNTPAHVIFSLALLGRNNAGQFAIAITLGALMPDVAMVLFYFIERIAGTPEEIIWNERYYLPVWQNVFDACNSIPLIVVGLMVSIVARSKVSAIFFASMLAHCLLDIPVHHDDGHRHFYPLSDFRFESPVSYWNPDHYGNYVLAAEFVLFCLGSVFLWTRQHSNQSSWLELTKLRTVILITSVVYTGYFVFAALTWANL